MCSVSKAGNSKVGISSDYKVNLEFDIFPSLLLYFSVCKGKGKNGEEIFSSGLCQYLSEKVL